MRWVRGRSSRGRSSACRSASCRSTSRDASWPAAPRLAPRPGDRLILTKPLGVGIYANALRRELLDAAGYEELIGTTTALNRIGAELGDLPAVHAVTDVTGFGLLGHALEMARGAGVALRLDAEQRLKNGELKAIVATASLEMGIDIGYIDLVCQIGSPRSIATFLQRIGRSGHSLGVVPKGRLFPLTRDELLECVAILRAARAGRLDTIEIPEKPIDILSQQIIAATACDEWREDDLFELCRRAWPYRELPRSEFDELIRMLHEGMSRQKHGAYLLRDAVNGRVRARRHARISAVTSGGAIPELADYRVITAEDRTFVGSVNEDFAIESLAVRLSRSAG